VTFWFPFTLLAIVVLSASAGIWAFLLICNSGRDTTPEPPAVGPAGDDERAHRPV